MSNTRHIASEQSDEMFDLDAYEAEATREPFRFRLKGQDFELCHTETIDWHDLDEKAGPDLVKLGLGEAQWKRFSALKLTAGGYKELQRRWFRHSGVSLGEGAASAAS